MDRKYPSSSLVFLILILTGPLFIFTSPATANSTNFKKQLREMGEGRELIGDPSIALMAAHDGPPEARAPAGSPIVL